MRVIALILIASLIAVPVSAKESLGVFADWGAFRDPQIPRCYAIAQPFGADPATSNSAFASVGTWPLRKVRGQVHFRLSTAAARGTAITLTIGAQRFGLTGRADNAWARDRAMDAAIIAAMRSASSMTVSMRDEKGQRIRDRYRLEGAASALDAATVACARRR